MPGHTTSVFLAAVGDLVRLWPRLLATDLVYKLLAFVVLTPVAGAALGMFVATSGSRMVADQDILRFIVSPIGLVALVVTGGVVLAIAALEQACLMTIAFAQLTGRTLGTTDALWDGARNAWRVLWLAVRISVRILILALPFLTAAGLVYLLLLQEHDINYYLAERPPIFLVAAGIVTSLVVMLVVLAVPRLIGWSFSLPLLLFERLSPAAAMAVSAQRVRGHRSTVAVVLLVWGAAAVLLSAMPVAMVRGLGEWLLPRFTGSTTALLLAMGAVLLLWMLVNLLTSLVSAVTFALLLVRLYAPPAAADRAILSAEIAQRLKAPRGRRPAVRVGIALLAVAALATMLVGALLVGQVRLDDDAVIIAHRGAAGRAPENTLASIAAALEDGADLVEVDVQETADGAVVVVHDADLMRVGGHPTRIRDGTLSELRAVDVGSWYGAEFTGQRVPTLEEVLELCRGSARVVVELKDYGRGVGLAERVAEIVERTAMTEQVIVMSLSGDMVRSMKALRPSWTVGLLTARAVGDLTRAEADFLAIHSDIASSAFIRRAHRAGKEIYVWTVNDRLNMSHMLSRGVDGLITDRPGLARQVMAERAALSTAERLLISAAFVIGLEPREPAPELDAGS